MDHIDNLRERFEAVEPQMNVMRAQTRAGTRRLRKQPLPRRATFLLIAGLMVALWCAVLSGRHAGAQGGAERSPLSQMQQRLLSGFASFTLNPSAVVSPRPLSLEQGDLALPLGQAALAVSGLDPTNPANYTPGPNGDCGLKTGSNVKVNQNCLSLSDSDLPGRGQAQNETSIAQDPNAPHHLVAAFNDYRRGDGNCGVAWSMNGGETWHDSTVPSGFVRGKAFGGVERQYFQAAGDPAVAWDTQGNAYLLCMMFMRGMPPTNNPDQSSALYVFRSTGNFGASWNFPGRPVAERDDTAGTGTTLLDKPLMTVDNTSGSPFQDRLYVTWTDFAADGSVYIFGAYSADYGETFSAPVLVSSNSPLCGNTFGLPTPRGHCNLNQFSQPFTGPDGALYVVWANFNNVVSGSDNRNQILLAKSTDGGRSFGAPVKVADYYDLPDCVTYQGQNPGRACVPEKGPGTNSFFRASNYPSGAVDPARPQRLVVAFGSYINPHSKESNGCLPNGFSPATGQNRYTGVKTPGACNNDILVSVSVNGGASFTGTTTDPRALTSATPTPAQATTDQWFQWIAFTQAGRLAISYYDRQYGNDETTGFSDVSLSGSENLTQFGVTRVTSSSMPPPTQLSGLFWGDYTGLTALDKAHPSWSDTRNPELFLCPGTGVPGEPPAVCFGSASNAEVANDQDVYTDAVNVPH
jgi:hypothetical protein